MPENSGSDKILVCGSRSWSDASRIYDVLKAVTFVWEMTIGPVKVIHGDAPGADRIAAHCARRLGIEVEAVPADWQTHGKRAGYLRNVQMVDQNPSLVIAFQKDGSTGTQHTIDIAFKRGINIMLFRDPEPLQRIQGRLEAITDVR